MTFNETLTQKVLFETDEEPKETSRPPRKGLSNYVKVPLITLGILACGFGGRIAFKEYQERKAREEYNQKRDIQLKKARKDRRDYVLAVARYEQPPNSKPFTLVDQTGDLTWLMHDLTFGLFYSLLPVVDLTDQEKKFIEKYRDEHPEYKPKGYQERKKSPEEERKEEEKEKKYIKFLEEREKRHKEIDRKYQEKNK